MDAYESHLLHCRRKVWGSVYRPIWEQYGIPGAPVSVPCQVIPSGILQVERPLLEPERADDDRLEALKLFKVRRTSLDRSWEQHCSSLRAAAIRKWHGIICTCLTAFQLGRQWNKQEPLGVAICTDLRHVFAGKSTGTLHNRSGPVLRYIAWCSRFGVQPFPLTEQVAYDFMKYEAVKASSTFLRSFIVSVAFSHYVLGLSGADLVMQSSRITGLAREMYLRKRKLVQRRPLTVKMVKALEDFAQDDSKSLFDRVAAGCFLLCVYMRARFSDMIHMTAFKADELFIDGFLEGYIECSVTRSKSAYTTERKTQFLPMAAPRRGLSSGDWFASWQAASVASGKPRGEDVPNLPVPTEVALGWFQSSNAVGLQTRTWSMWELTAARVLVCLGARSMECPWMSEGIWDFTVCLAIRLPLFTAVMLQQDRCDTLMKSFVQFVRELLTLIRQGVGISVWRPLQAQTNLLILRCLASLWLYRMTLRSDPRWGQKIPRVKIRRMKKMMRAAKRLWSMRLKW